MRTLVLLLTVSLAYADERRELRQAGPCEWDARFRAGSVAIPSGKTDGTVLYAEGMLPKVKARLQGTVWKGKHFLNDAEMINRWRGFEAVNACVYIDNSWLDGQPCVVLQYADNARVFGGVRDEIRLISPGTWIGRAYDTRTGEVKTHFLLQMR